MERDKWSSRSTFVLAAIGSAVGLGNAWRFPGLAAKHGGGAFLLVYLLAMIFFGIPLLMMEISIGRKMRQSAPGALAGINKKLEPIGWAATANAFVIVTYYAVVFAWVILMAGISYKFAGLTGNTEAARSLWATTIKTTGTVSGYGTIAWPVLIALVIAWGAIYYCIRNGTESVGKVIKYTVLLPVICLLILAVRGFFLPGSIDGLVKFFVPDFSALSSVTIWIDACGQVFYSLSIMMAIMIAYGSFLDRDTNVALDATIIAFCDMAVSVLAGIVTFLTMGGVGMLDNISASGIATAFFIYPQAIVLLTNTGWVNAIFAFIFYFCLCTLAIDSAFSLVEGVSTAISDRFEVPKKKTTIIVCLVSGAISLFFVTGAGLAWLDIVDNWCNNYNLILIGIIESVAIGWIFNTTKVLEEVNRNTKKFKMPAGFFNIAIKFIAPAILTAFFIWNIVTLIRNGGVYGAADGYTLTSNILGGWLISVLVFASGYIIKALFKNKMVKDIQSWDEIDK
jgi:NSS family neurotransmitter:Na+ symporter